MNLFLKMTGVIMIMFLAGCGQDMKDNSRLKPFEKDAFFKNNSSARPLPAGTIARGHLKSPTVFFTGKEHGVFSSFNPVPASREFFEYGRERFNIYCAVCHGQTGEGNGMVVQRGFPRPASFYIDRLRQAPDGYFFDVMTNGKGTMAPNRDVLNEYDRWAIAAYIRVLQKSRQCPLNRAPKKVQEKLKRLGPQQSGVVYE